MQLDGDINERVARVEAKLDHNTEATDRIELRVNKIDLNGHGPDIKAIAGMRADIEDVVRLKPRLEAIADAFTSNRIAIVVRGADDRADLDRFWVVVKRKTRWDRGGSAWAKVIVGGLLSGSMLVEMTKLIFTGHW